MLLLVLEGGGMRAGFVAGALMAFMDRGLIGFDAALAVSASVPSLGYFAAGQRKEMEDVWRQELNNPKLVCYRNIPAASLAPSVKRPVLNIDYLVYDIFRARYPINMEAVLGNPMECHFAATIAPHGKLALLSPKWGDIYAIFKACMAVPGCYPGTVCIDENEYVDGGMANPLPVRGFIDQATDRVVAVLSKPIDCESDPPTFLERTLFWRYFKKYDWMIERLFEAAQIYADEVNYLEMLTQQTPPRSLIISPDRMPPAKFITRDRTKINRTIDMGYRAVEAIEHAIRDFMAG